VYYLGLKKPHQLHWQASAAWLSNPFVFFAITALMLLSYVLVVL
jgi:hypothetical protein